MTDRRTIGIASDHAGFDLKQVLKEELRKLGRTVVDLGPEGGHRGGQILATGTPEDIVAEKRSYTGQFLKELLERRPKAKRQDVAAE